MGPPICEITTWGPGTSDAGREDRGLPLNPNSDQTSNNSWRTRPAKKNARWQRPASVFKKAERQGFEPWVPLRVLRFSRPVHSAALPSLQAEILGRSLRTVNTPLSSRPVDFSVPKTDPQTCRIVTTQWPAHATELPLTLRRRASRLALVLSELAKKQLAFVMKASCEIEAELRLLSGRVG